MASVSAASGGCLAVEDSGSPFHGAGICVPPGALAEDTVISIYDPADRDPDAPEGGAVAPYRMDEFPAGLPVEFEPSGLVFSTPATIRLPYDPAVLDYAWTPPSGIRVYAHERPGDPSYEVEQTGADSEVHLVSASITSFTTFQPHVSLPPFQQTAANAWRAKIRVG